MVLLWSPNREPLFTVGSAAVGAQRRGVYNCLDLSLKHATEHQQGRPTFVIAVEGADASLCILCCCDLFVLLGHQKRACHK